VVKKAGGSTEKKLTHLKHQHFFNKRAKKGLPKEVLSKKKRGGYRGPPHGAGGALFLGAPLINGRQYLWGAPFFL